MGFIYPQMIMHLGNGKLTQIAIEIYFKENIKELPQHFPFQKNFK